jgi:arylsulfatase A-like enzyme
LFHYDGGSVAKYVEMVQDMDAAIGEVLRALRDTGQHRNTIVLFTSDNGGERFSYQWPLRGAKVDALEGGIRVPTILRWPAGVSAGQVSDVPVVSMDWTRTLLAAAGAAPDPGYPMDGRDLSDYLWGSGRPPAGDLFWRVVDQGALRRGKWKYWVSQDVDRNVVAEGLFDLSVDRREEADLARKRPALLAELRDAWNRIEETLLDYPPGAVRFE